MKRHAISAVVLALVFAAACAVATRDPNRMVATLYRPLPAQPSFVIVKSDDSIGEGLELFEDVLADAFVARGFSRARDPARAELAVIYGFECLTDAPRSARAENQEIGVTHLKISVLNLHAKVGLKRGASYWAAAGSTEDAGCNPTQSGVWLVPRMLEYFGETVDPARALTD